MAKRQDDDGTTHITYFDKTNALSYVWNGSGPYIQVAEGGYAEPVVGELEIPQIYGGQRVFPVEGERFSDTLKRFTSLVKLHAAGWPATKSLLTGVEDDD